MKCLAAILPLLLFGCNNTETTTTKKSDVPSNVESTYANDHSIGEPFPNGTHNYIFADQTDSVWVTITNKNGKISGQIDLAFEDGFSSGAFSGRTDSLNELHVITNFADSGEDLPSEEMLFRMKNGSLQQFIGELVEIKDLLVLQYTGNAGWKRTFVKDLE